MKKMTVFALIILATISFVACSNAEISTSEPRETSSATVTEPIVQQSTSIEQVNKNIPPEPSPTSIQTSVPTKTQVLTQTPDSAIPASGKPQLIEFYADW